MKNTFHIVSSLNSYLIRFITIAALTMMTNLALAVDDATVSAIDTKAAVANAKADDNNSRIQGLENDLVTETTQRMAADADLQQQIDNIELIPGEKGDKGDTGATGDVGPQGPAGAAGAKGDQGEPGVKGQDGTSCSVADNGDGTKTISCTDGSSVLVSDGAQGPQGERGPQGVQGPAGADGEPLPAGAAPGDMLYWDGLVWQLSPAPPVGAATPPVLTLINGVPTWTTPTSDHRYAIGDVGPAGGIVFYIREGGLHGLEAATADQSTAHWGCSGTAIDGADGIAVGTGAQNTADIVAGCSEAGIAARLAAAYSLNGYNDWFLPSKDELHLLYLQKDLVGGFANVPYWSSSEYDNAGAWYQYFLDGNQFNFTKYAQYAFRVRAIRAF